MQCEAAFRRPSNNEAMTAIPFPLGLYPVLVTGPFPCRHGRIWYIIQLGIFNKVGSSLFIDRFKFPASWKMEPSGRIELPTYALRKRRSTN